jgi:hypothetical protein
MDRLRRELDALRSRGPRSSGGGSGSAPSTPSSGAASGGLEDAPRFDGVTIREQVADSGQARVYRAEFRGEDVAAKVFHLSESALKQYREEVASLLYERACLLCDDRFCSRVCVGGCRIRMCSGFAWCLRFRVRVC